MTTYPIEAARPRAGTTCCRGCGLVLRYDSDNSAQEPQWPELGGGRGGVAARHRVVPHSASSLRRYGGRRGPDASTGVRHDAALARSTAGHERTGGIFDLRRLQRDRDRRSSRGARFGRAAQRRPRPQSEDACDDGTRRKVAQTPARADERAAACDRSLVAG